jgi:O-acetyl-ADP-ribose deacetylase (regulator of RNase III)
MITEARGNLLEADVDALVNTVNTVGVMGKGIALQFKRAYPEMFKAYARAAKRGELSLGQMHVWETGLMTGPRFIINFPTKGHWKARSRLDDVARGLDALVETIRDLGIKSIAIPPLGCGQGGLDWLVVEPLIADKLAKVPAVDARVYPPVGAPSAASMVTAGPAPRLTPVRGALLTLMSDYSKHALGSPTLIEVQKLAYFLQAAGEVLNLRFEPHHYGPYADTLRKVLRDLEGHYIKGFGDGSSKVGEAAPIDVMPGAADAATALIEADDATAEHLRRVLDLVEGFESSYGLELLATVHWLLVHQPELADDMDELSRRVQSWTPRKRQLFGTEHVRTAARTLIERGWVRRTALA